MRLIDLDATESYLLDGRYVVDPVKHGRWYDEPNYLGTCMTMFFCSRCGSASFREDPYCWHCGAKMDGRENNDTD